jgi:hypothetical protein
MSELDMAGTIFKYIWDKKWNLKFHHHVFFLDSNRMISFQRIFQKVTTNLQQQPNIVSWEEWSSVRKSRNPHHKPCNKSRPSSPDKNSLHHFKY